MIFFCKAFCKVLLTKPSIFEVWIWCSILNDHIQPLLCFCWQYGQLWRNSLIETQRLTGVAPARKHSLRGVKKGFAKGKALHILKTNSTRFTFIKKRTELKNTTKEGDRGYLTKFWRNTCLVLSAPVENGH